jgi:hypothetical protein
MRLLKLAALALGVTAATVPAVAAIKAMTLSELMEISTDVVHVRILEKETFRSDWPFEGAVYTRMHVEGISLQTGQPVDTHVVYLGSHDPADQYGTSEMPTLQDTRVGNEAVVFYTHEQAMPGQPNVAHCLANVYRVERAFSQPVVIGKGEGFAFTENIKLADASQRVRETYVQLQAAKAQGDK